MGDGNDGRLCGGGVTERMQGCPPRQFSDFAQPVNPMATIAGPRERVDGGKESEGGWERRKTKEEPREAKQGNELYMKQRRPES